METLLYSPPITPTQRKLLDAKKAREAKICKAVPRPCIAPIAVPEAAEAPAPVPQPIPISLKEKIDIISKIVAREFGLTTAALLSRTQQHYIAHPRQVAMYFVVHLLKRSYPDTARRFGRDHTTALNADRRVLKRMDADPHYAETIAKLRSDILTAFGAAQ
jgi:hypothetical protein